MEPSQPGYSFRRADIISPGAPNLLTDQALQQIIHHSNINQQNGVLQDEASPAVMGLLANLLRVTKPANARFNVYPINVGGPSATPGSVIQALPANPNRVSLFIAVSAASTHAWVSFDESSVTLKQVPLDADAQQYVQRGFLLSSIPDEGNAPSFIEFQTPPTNAITLYSDIADSRLIVIEGVR